MSGRYVLDLARPEDESGLRALFRGKPDGEFDARCI